MNKVTNAIKCIDCQQILQQPVLIPCGHTICNHHASRSGSSYTCPICRVEYFPSVEGGGFPPNKALETMVSEIPALDFGQDHKRAVQVCNDLTTEIQTLKSICDDPVHYIHERSSEYRNRVDLKREMIKLAIDEYADKLIKSIEEHEKECKTEISSSDIEGFFHPAWEMVNMAMPKRDEFVGTLNSLKVDIKQYEETTNKCADLVGMLRRKIKEIDFGMFLDNKSIENQIARFEAIDIPFEKK